MESLSSLQETPARSSSSGNDEIAVNCREDLLPYRENPSLASLPVKSLKIISSVGWV